MKKLDVVLQKKSKIGSYTCKSNGSRAHKNLLKALLFKIDTLSNKIKIRYSSFIAFRSSSN